MFNLITVKYVSTEWKKYTQLMGHGYLFCLPLISKFHIICGYWFKNFKFMNT